MIEPETAFADLVDNRDLRRYGTVPHAGPGFGFERTMAYVTVDLDVPPGGASQR